MNSWYIQQLIPAGMSLIGVLFVPTVSECCSSRKIIGYVGQNVTLVCTYDATTKQLHACWGRGWIPALGCNQQLISTDGHKINKGTRVSNRYQLLGRLDKGDVSLTILNITKADSGQYGCRVEKPGLFNDEKHHISLVVQEGESMFSFILHEKLNYRQAIGTFKGTYMPKKVQNILNKCHERPLLANPDVEGC